ncbi:type I glyceraldehyde-3-phosphate dehydrogenase [[Mycoplasma] mobile]|uniref:Glyceraldehyde-3-phosphate dehydrogenase n=1 Tax=Mycoplasma mobile (strain ATCC 43663 / 163K / NCTC 11711) TaxID=267748 RepID=Q6KIA3_MYCM1|nr:type I glyceraldehyde-3-phosphate dehydrogenase [[Mycoplasma] mobile]AAT27673.1 glyceraldehyde 3-phosphate dehydrogenase [Mycoplasma mobile 163K]
MKKIAINGFGRIGRVILRTILSDATSSKNIQVIAINDLTDANTLAHLFKYDSIYGNFNGSIKVDEKAESLIINGHKIRILSESDPLKLPWGDLGIDLVIESTGRFATKEQASQHLKSGAKKVLISAPAKGAGIPTVVHNVNHQILNASDTIISTASCTTNSLAPVAHAINKEFGIESGLMTTIHGYTADQKLHDAPHSDLRRARAAATNIVPTSSGAAIAIGLVIPELDGKLAGGALRVPVITGSVVDLTFTTTQPATVKGINEAIKKHANESMRYETNPIVSSDIIGATEGTIFDSLLTQEISSKNGKKLFKITTWYDNESSYVNQVVRTLNYFLKLN